VTKKEHIAYWKDTAARDWKFVQQTFKIKQYVYALFFAHLVLEKLCKAHWVKDNKNNYPPKIHNLVRLIEQTNLKFTDEEMDFFRKLNDFQLEGRYPDYKQELYRAYKAHNTGLILKKVNQLRLCLLKELQ
jgi:HEPN domain-containing protein